MGILVYLLEMLYPVFCRHEWIRDRRPNGRLGLRCMKCMKQKDHDLLRLIEWKPDYTPIDPAHQPDFPPPLTDMESAPYNS